MNTNKPRKGNHRIGQIVAGILAAPIILIGLAGVASAAPVSKPVPASVTHFVETHVGCSVTTGGGFTVSCSRVLISYTLSGGKGFDLVIVRFSPTGAVTFSEEILQTVAPVCTTVAINNVIVSITPHNPICGFVPKAMLTLAA